MSDPTLTKQFLLTRKSPAYRRVTIMPPAAQERLKKLMEQGFHKPGDVENRLGYHVGLGLADGSAAPDSPMTLEKRSR